MTARGSCLFGYQFEFSAFMIDSRMRSFSVLLAAMLVQEPKDGWVAKELILVSEWEFKLVTGVLIKLEVGFDALTGESWKYTSGNCASLSTRIRLLSSRRVPDTMAWHCDSSCSSTTMGPELEQELTGFCLKIATCCELCSSDIPYSWCWSLTTCSNSVDLVPILWSSICKGRPGSNNPTLLLFIALLSYPALSPSGVIIYRSFLRSWRYVLRSVHVMKNTTAS